MSEFDRTLLKAVDDGLLVLGESARHVIYHTVERLHYVRREEIPERLEAFHEALEALLSAGARVAEKRIAQNLCCRIGLSFEDNAGWTLVDYVCHAKKAVEGGPKGSVEA